MSGPLGTRNSRASTTSAVQVSPTNNNSNEEAQSRIENNEDNDKSICRIIQKMMLQDLEDLEGLLINLGVLASLCLSFSIGMYSTIPLEELALGEYKDLVFYDGEFRKLVVDVLKKDGFNFTVSLGGKHGVLNIEEVLLRKDYPNLQLKYWEPKQQRLNAAFHLTKGAFPMDTTLAYVSLNGYGLGDVLGARCGGNATYLFCFSLTVALGFYLAMTLSNVREALRNGEKKPLQHFSNFAMPAIIVAFVSLLLGCVYFLWGLNSLSMVRFPNWGTVVYYVIANDVLVCLNGTTFAIAVGAVASSHYTDLEKDKTIAKRVACSIFVICLIQSLNLISQSIFDGVWHGHN